MKRIAVIGGGSIYVTGILRTLVNHAKQLAGATVVLQDIDPEPLELMCALGKNLVRAAGADLTITSTLDLDESLAGADFVLTCFRVGGFDALKLDEEIPLKYGIFGEETAGPGGIFYALRTVPVAVAIAKRMEKICPDAYFINYANPTNFVADAVRRTTAVEEYSLCDGFKGAAGTVAAILGLDPEDIVAVTAGVNHCTWLLDCRANGRDLYPEYRRKVAALDRSGMNWKGECFYKIIDTYGYVPVPHGHMLQYFYRDEAVERLKQGEDPLVYQKLGVTRDALWKHFKTLTVADKPEFDMSLEGMHHYVDAVSDYAMSVILAIATDSRGVFTLNLPNQGQISNMPLGDIVEGPAYVGAFGARPIAVGAMPEPLLPLLVALNTSRRLTVDAALTGDKQKLLQAILANPLVDSIRCAEPMMEEMLKAEAQWLPQFS